MINLNCNKALRVWINEDPVLNYRQYELPCKRSSEAVIAEELSRLFKPVVPELSSITNLETLQIFLS